MMRFRAIPRKVMISVFLLFLREASSSETDCKQSPSRGYASMDLCEYHLKRTIPLDTVSFLQGANMRVHDDRELKMRVHEDSLSNLKDGAVALENDAWDASDATIATLKFDPISSPGTHLVNSARALQVAVKLRVEGLGVAITKVSLIILILSFAMGALCCATCICVIQRRRMCRDDLLVGTGGVMGPWASIRIGLQPRMVWESEAERRQDACTENLPWASQSQLVLREGISSMSTLDDSGTPLPRPTPTLSAVGTLFAGRGRQPTQTSLAAGAGQPRASSHRSAEERILPPPLCRTFVLPVCEARYGVPMHELRSLAAEGELDILGLSRNTVLRATLKMFGELRGLEIGRPEANSVPRVIVRPAEDEMQSFEIRDRKGGLYGLLKVASSRACHLGYVLKDGRKVLVVDGSVDSFQLEIKSCSGVELASARCSSELFDGVEHLEVRVEPGVDALLVVSCVLAMLLLSPQPD